MIATIIWSHRGFPMQWAASDGKDHWAKGFMKGYELDDCWRLGGVSMNVWHAALTDAMHWAYEPLSQPPQGWHVAQPHELALCVPGDDGDD